MAPKLWEKMWMIMDMMNDIVISDTANSFAVKLSPQLQQRPLALWKIPWWLNSLVVLWGTGCCVLIQTRYGSLRAWDPSFVPSSAVPSKIVAWVHFPELPVQYYNPTILHAIGAKLGRVITVDEYTFMEHYGKFARVAIELDIAKPLYAFYTVEGVIVRIEYENLPEGGARLEPQSDKLGPWIHAQTKKPHAPRNKNPQSKNGHKQILTFKGSGSRFGILTDLEEDNSNVGAPKADKGKDKEQRELP
ncbi:hypothetical protein GH714_043101 [Hevea brasiliensis]|uniref:Uncharacterized protein n=1 Tax=Hevea brasiliensis TaxID=3981 RepID=A0A6A6K206_HEVBR|nr:hypothetical protein GH714_043101 [Hevea brasiliensis]